MFQKSRYKPKNKASILAEKYPDVKLRKEKAVRKNAIKNKNKNNFFKKPENRNKINFALFTAIKPCVFLI
jgi:hypothetical protein